MPIQSLKQDSLASLLGQGLGQGLGAGLGKLAENKLQALRQQSEQRRYREQITPLLAQLGQQGNVPPEQIDKISQFLGAQRPEDRSAAFGYVNSLLGGMAQPQGLQQQVPQQQAPQEQVVPQQELPQMPFGSQDQQVPQQQPVSPVQEIIQQAQQQPQERPPLFETAQQKVQREARSEASTFKQQERAEKRQAHIDKQVSPFIKETHEKGQGGREDLERFNAMEDLIKDGNLINPLAASALEKLSHGVFGMGIDLFSLASPQTQSFRKLSKDFAKSAKKYFGGRITQGEINLLLDTVPALSQSEEGKLGILDRLKPVASAAALYDKTLKEVLDEYDYQPPRNLEAIVDKRLKPQLDILANKIKKEANSRDNQMLLRRWNSIPIKERKKLMEESKKKFQPTEEAIKGKQYTQEDFEKIREERKKRLGL